MLNNSDYNYYYDVLGNGVLQSVVDHSVPKIKILEQEKELEEKMAQTRIWKL